MGEREPMTINLTPDEIEELALLTNRRKRDLERIGKMNEDQLIELELLTNLHDKLENSGWNMKGAS